MHSPGRRRTLLAAGIALVAAVPWAASLAQASPSHTARAVHTGTDSPRRVRPGPATSLPATASEPASDDHPIPALETGRAVAAAPPQPIVFSTNGSPPLQASFAGLNLLDGRADPPDPDLAAGNGSVVEVVNDAIRVFGTDGSLRATYGAGTFFGSTSGDVTDPSIVFDTASGRWFASILDSGDGTVRLAVSQTGDPTGAWQIYDHAPGFCADQPTLGVSGTLVVIGYGGFTLPCRSASPSYRGGGHYVYNKAELLSGATAHFTAWDPNPPFAPVSAVTAGPDPATSLTLTTNFYLEVLTYSGVPTATTSVTYQDTTVVVRDLVQPPPATQKNGTKPIDTGDVRIRGAAENPADGTVWVAFDDSFLPAVDTTGRSCLRM